MNLNLARARAGADHADTKGHVGHALARQKALLGRIGPGRLARVKDGYNRCGWA
jgi:hypothetical protein